MNAEQAAVRQADHDNAVTRAMKVVVSEPTMSSREIADLVESRHDNVKVAIERLAERGVIEFPATQEIPTATKPVTEYRVSKRDSYIIVAQLSPEFTARLVDRWQELEYGQAAPAFKVPATFSDALRLAAEQAEQLEAQAKQIEQQKPAVEFVGRYVEATGSKGFREVAKLLRANEREFRNWLLDRHIMYYLGGRMMPRQAHIETGRFEVKAGATDDGHAFNQAKFTPKGITWIAGEWGKRAVEGVL